MRRAAQEAAMLAAVVVLALVVWFVIVDAENREVEFRLGFSLQVDVRDLGSDLVVAGEPLPVTVTVVGREADVEDARRRSTFWRRSRCATEPPDSTACRSACRRWRARSAFAPCSPKRWSSPCSRASSAKCRSSPSRRTCRRWDSASVRRTVDARDGDRLGHRGRGRGGVFGGGAARSGRRHGLAGAPTCGSKRGRRRAARSVRC